MVILPSAGFGLLRVPPLFAGFIVFFLAARCGMRKLGGVFFGIGLWIDRVRGPS